MPSKYDSDFRARVLIDAVRMGDQPAADKHGVSRRSVIRWRNRMEDDTELAHAVTSKLRRLEQTEWVEKIPDTIQAGLDYLERSMDAAKAGDPDAINAVSQALYRITQVYGMVRMLNAKLPDPHRARHSEDGEAVPGEFRQLTDGEQ